MAFAIPKVGYRSMMKEGTRNYQGLEEAVYRNIDACKKFADITKSSYGPNGMKKIIVNHLDKLFITKDAATIVKELEVEHPAAKILVMASKMAEQEVGDGTNLVIQFAAELMFCALDLLKFGVPPTDIIDAFNNCLQKTITILNSLVVFEVTDTRDIAQIKPIIRSSVMTKTMNYEFVSDLITRACLISSPVHSKRFDVDDIRIVKILGASVESSDVVQGLAVKTDVSGAITEINDVKMVVFNTDFDLTNPETKGTVLLNTSAELLSFSSGEEGLLKNAIKELKDLGINLVVCSGKIADPALDFSNRFGIMVVRITSKFELQRLCRSTMSTPLPSFVKPTPEQIGHCKHVHVREIGDSNVVVFEQESQETSVSTIIIRGSSDSVLDDTERAINDGVNAYKSLIMNPKAIPGAGATEIEVSVQLSKMSENAVGFEKLAFAKFCEAFKNLVRNILQNNGMKTNDVLSKLYSEHQAGTNYTGVDVRTSNGTCDVRKEGIYDLLMVKSRCLQLAVDAVSTLLSVDQIIVARPAGGPVPKQNPAWDQD